MIMRGLMLVFAGVSLVWWANGWPLGVDSSVYRSGALAVWHGEALYGHLSATPAWSPDLPFAYPPVAALLFLPLAALPVQIGWGVITILTVLALRTVTRLAGAAHLLPVVLLLEPVWRTIGLGQINVVLMALVVVDVLRGSRYGGVLIGLAAAIKLTPLIFVLHLLLTRRWADAGRAAGTFAGLNAIGFVVLPGDSARYWTSTLFGANSAMTNSWSGNQSLNGLVLRLGGGPVLLGVLAAACVAVAVLLVRRTNGVGALTVTAALGLLLSPISWTHHWVWVVLPCCLVATRSRWGVAAIVAWFSGWAFVVVPRGDGRELSWNAMEIVIGNGYVLLALAAGALTLAHLTLRRQFIRGVL